MLARRRELAIAAGLLVLLAVVYKLFLADTELAPERIRIGFATSVLGEGEAGIGVTPDGELLSGEPAPKEGTLPSLPPVQAPKSGRLGGPMLEQAKVLGAAPAPLRSCTARSFYEQDGVTVELRSGIELRFGDPARAADKWASAVTLLADPTITAVDYVNVEAPSRPSTKGSGHVLPPPGEGEGEGCGP